MRELTTELTGRPPRVTSTEYEYFHGNFQDRLKPGMGIEMVYELLGQVGRASRWVDLGAGPFSALWGLGIAAEQLTAVDTSPLNLWLNNRYWTDLLDGAYATSLVDAGLVPEAARDRMRELHRRYVIGDVFQPAQTLGTDDEPEGAADAVTAIGLLGLARDEGEVTSALGVVHRAVRTGGRFVGASWLRHDAPTPAFAADWPDVLCHLSELVGLQVEDTRLVALAGDNAFATVLGWTMRAPERC